MKAVLVTACACLVVLLSGGCDSAPMPPGMVPFFQTPSLQAVLSPAMESGTYHKFTVVPSSKETADSGMHPFVEKQLLFMVRTELERLGYQYVESPEQADFSLRLTYSNDYKRGDSIATTATTSYSDSEGGFGFARSHGTATKWASYCPILQVIALDMDTTEEIWSGSVLAETPSPEIRLSANHLLSSLLVEHFPLASDAGEALDSRDGIFGCDFRIITLDGNDYFPAIMGLLTWSRTGRNLCMYDVITEIDGNSTKNRSYSEIRATFDRNPGEKLSLTVMRSGKTRKITIVAIREATVRNLELWVADYDMDGTWTASLWSPRTQWPTLSKKALLNLVP